jgi:deoxyribodipyrimidine photo-lyase
MIHPDRIQELNENKTRPGVYVLYWMQASNRAHYNHALEYSIKVANSLNKPLIVYFGLYNEFPESNTRHYQFLIQGLNNTRYLLEKNNIKMVITKKLPPEGALQMAEEASMIVTDRGYLPVQREWRQELSKNIECPLVQVESDVVVPIETVSSKEEYSAATIRRKINKYLDEFMTPFKHSYIKNNSLDYDFESLPIEDVKKTMQLLDIREKVVPLTGFQGGNTSAQKRFNYFLENKLDHFSDLRNDPTVDYLSHMGPYIHFGQISPLFLAFEVQKIKSPGSAAYLEELIIRRELSMNFVYYDPDFDNFNCLPDWAKKTLLEHSRDPREYSYSLDELEKAQTHDPYWNAAQKEMVHFGKMHGYMRMYWGKKILEWTDNPLQAYPTALYLNNKYELDGRDPNGYAGVAWCFGKHDRAWKERDIFGKVRYMNDNGLRRKFKIEKYLEKIDSMIEKLT